MSCAFHTVALNEVAHPPSQVLTWYLMKYNHVLDPSMNEVCIVTLVVHLK